MNNDESRSDAGGPTQDAALEARIVAWVLGEASAFEVAELERIVQAEPELAVFKRRLEAVHGLLGEAARTRVQGTIQLEPARRARLLTALGAHDDAQASVGGSPAVAEPNAVRQRRMGPEWKALRLYFGVTAACALVFFAVTRLATTGRNLPLGLQRATESDVYLSAIEPEEGVHALEESKAMIEMRQHKRLMSDAEFDAELARRENELHEAEQELAAMEDNAVIATPWRQSMPAPTGSGAITVPVARHIGSARAGSGGIDLDAFSQSTREDLAFDDEPETVPEGDENQRVELPLYEIAATSDVSYTATSTLAGTRLHTSLSDIGSAISVSETRYLQDTTGSASRASPGTFTGQLGAMAPRAKDADAAWTEGFGQPQASTPTEPTGAVAVIGQQFLSDLGATDNSTLLQYTSNTDVSGVQGNYASDRMTRAESAVSGDALFKKERYSQTDAATGQPAPGQDAFQGFLGEPGRRDILFGQGAAPAGQLRGLDAPGKSPTVQWSDFPKGEKQAAPPPPMRGDAKLKRAPTQADRPATVDEAHAAREPVSTFSLHVSDASFRLAQAALGRGERPEPGTIRPEEFYNAFDYGDPSPAIDQKVSCRIEQAAHPFVQQRTLVRVAMKVAATGRGAGQPLRLTVLLDTSGSMEREDRAAAVRRAFEVLATLVGPDDRITLIGFSRQPRLLAEAVSGAEAKRLVDVMAQTPAEGGTNIEAALTLAAELAQRHFVAQAQNRIVVLTDGAANLGNADPAQLARQIETLRGRGIAFDACGVGTDGLDDEILEALTRKGDGRYYVLDSPADADAGFARQLAGAFRPAAKNVKVQVRFNPARVGAYRLIGFEKHRLREEDFRNDKVDAAELASEEAAVALYQVEALPDGAGEIGEVSVRFRDMASGHMVERSWTITHDRRVPAFDRTTPTMQLAGTAAMLAEVLRGGPVADSVDLGALVPVMNRLRSHYASQPRVLELATMFETLRRKAGE